MITLLSTLLVALAPTAPPAPVPEPAKFMSFAQGRPVPAKPRDPADAGKPLPWDRTQAMTIQIDRDRLLAALSIKPASPDQADRIRLYQSAAGALLKVGPARIQYQFHMARSMALLKAQAAGKGPAPDPAAVSQERALAKPFGDQASQAFHSFVGMAETIQGQDPALYAAFNQALRQDLSAQAFATMAGLLQDRLRTLLAALNHRSEGAAGEDGLLLQADWIGEDGRSRALHVPGYDQISTGPGAPFGQLTLVLDARGQAEWNAATQLGTTLTKVFSEDFQTNLRESLNQLRANLQQDATDLQASLADLAKALEGIPTGAGKEAKDQFDAMVARLTLTCAVPVTDVPTLLSGLQNCYDALKAAPVALDQQVRKILADLQTNLQSLPAATIGAVTPVLDRVKSQLDSFLVKIRTDVLGPLENLGILLKASDGLWQDVDAVSRKAKALLDEAGQARDLDSTVDLATVVAPRPDPGDRIIVSASVLHTNPGAKPEVRLSRSQTFSVEQFGLYWDRPEVALLVVQPRSARIPSSNQSYVPSVSFNLRLGLRDCDVWNHLVAPGLGLSVASLRLDPARDGELGVALNLSLFQRLFWVGYGRDLQVRGNYAYFGINPLVMYGWFQGRNSAR